MTQLLENQTANGSGATVSLRSGDYAVSITGTENGASFKIEGDVEGEGFEDVEGTTVTTVGAPRFIVSLPTGDYKATLASVGDSTDLSAHANRVNDRTKA